MAQQFLISILYHSKLKLNAHDLKRMYLYIYPRGRRFTGNSCPKGVYIYEVGVGLGWGGVGMVTFLELAHMVGATQHHVPCTCTHGRCYASHGIGVGWGGDDNVP